MIYDPKCHKERRRMRTWQYMNSVSRLSQLFIFGFLCICSFVFSIFLCTRLDRGGHSAASGDQPTLMATFQAQVQILGKENLIRRDWVRHVRLIQRTWAGESSSLRIHMGENAQRKRSCLHSPLYEWIKEGTLSKFTQEINSKKRFQNTEFCLCLKPK